MTTKQPSSWPNFNKHGNSQLLIRPILLLSMLIADWDTHVYWILAAIFSLAAILSFLLGQRGLLSKMHTSEPNNHPV